MKRWTLPVKYKCMGNLFVLPLGFDRRKEIISILDMSEQVQDLLRIFNLLPYTSNDIPCGITWDDAEQERRHHIAAMVNAKAYIQGAIGYIVMEKMGYNMGKLPPSAYFDKHNVPTVRTQEHAEEVAKRIVELSGTFRAAIMDWGIYVHCNDLSEFLDSYWFYTEKQQWRHNKITRNDVQLIWA